MGSSYPIARLCIDCGTWYYRAQRSYEPRRCLDCAIEYDENVVLSQAGRLDTDYVTRKYVGRWDPDPDPKPTRGNDHGDKGPGGSRAEVGDERR